MAIVATVFFAVSNEAAVADVSVQTQNGLVYVRLNDLEHDPQTIEDAAATAGLDITVDEMPVGPSLVGRFVGYGFAGERPGTLKELDRDGPAFSGFVIPAGYDGTLVLRVGRPAQPGEPYAQFANATSEGEALACTGILGASPAEALEVVAARDLDTLWLVVSGTGQRPVDAADLDEEGDDLVVRRALAAGPGRVLITLADPDTTLDDVELTSPATC